MPFNTWQVNSLSLSPQNLCFFFLYKHYQTQKTKNIKNSNWVFYWKHKKIRLWLLFNRNIVQNFIQFILWTHVYFSTTSFSKTCLPFCILISNVWAFQLLCTLTNPCCCHFKNVTRSSVCVLCLHILEANMLSGP